MISIAKIPGARHQRTGVAVVAALMALALSGGIAAAQGFGANLNITPKRLALDRTHRTGTIYVYNQGDTVTTFDVGLVDRVMLPDGQILSVDDAAAKPELKPTLDQLKSAKDLLLASPRRISLAPKQGQTIRVRVSTLPEGDAAIEYRSHLTISTLPQRDEGTTADQAASGPTSQLSFKINSLYGISIPVIVRAGAADVRAAIENVHVTYEDMRPNPSAPTVHTAVVNFDLVRVGANSLFGNLAVRLSGQNPKDPPAGLALSVGVYPEVARRHMHLPLTRIPAAGETVSITFTDDDLTPGKVLATSAP